MHEVGIAQNALEMAIQAARASGGTQIHKIHLKVGVMTGVVPEALQFAFESLREGTMAHAATLSVEQVPLTCWCRRCQIEFSSPEMLYECPQCRQFDTEIRRGLELELASLEAS
jgi:hydrogenase nickel incorporation protein HypA/HybF